MQIYLEFSKYWISSQVPHAINNYSYNIIQKRILIHKSVKN
jgi:hypothetical protein